MTEPPESRWRPRGVLGRPRINSTRAPCVLHHNLQRAPATSTVPPSPPRSTITSWSIRSSSTPSPRRRGLHPWRIHRRRGRARRARHRSQPRRSERAGPRREPSGRSGPLLRGLPRLAAHPRIREVHPRVGGGTDRRRADGLTAGAPLSRPRAVSRRRASRRRGIRTSRTTTSTAGRSARSGCPSTRLTASRLSSSSPARISVRGSCRGRSWTRRRSGSPREPRGPA